MYVATTPYPREGRNALKGKNHLTEEQDALRLRGLRILARIIVRAHLTSQLNGDAEKSDPPDDSTGDPVVHGRERENAA